MELSELPVETICPICRKPVTKVKDTKDENSVTVDKNDVVCFNEFYIHSSKGNLLFKIKNPETLWSQKK